MFEGDYTIYGKHATYIKYLKEAKIFSRYIDVYMAGAVLGALYEKRASQTDSSDRARIYADAFDTEHARCNEIFKIVILWLNATFSVSCYKCRIRDITGKESKRQVFLRIFKSLDFPYNCS